MIATDVSFYLWKRMAGGQVVKVREAVERAQAYLPEVFPVDGAQDLRLEAIELSDDSRVWQVTFSLAPVGGLLGRIGRDYKTVKLRAEDGEFVAARNEVWPL